MSRRAQKDSVIVFYDITAKEQVSWSPNTLKVHYVLGYKELPYHTEWLSYPDIAQNHKEIGIENSSEAHWQYTCPAIKDGEKALQNSGTIVDYLEKTYPNSPSVFPDAASRVLSAAIGKLIGSTWGPHFMKLIFPKMPNFLDERGGKYFAEDRQAIFGVPMSQFCAEEDIEKHWKGLEPAVKTIGELLRAEPGPYLTGKKPIYGDFFIASWVRWIHLASPKDGERLLGFSSEVKELYTAAEEYL